MPHFPPRRARCAAALVLSLTAAGLAGGSPASAAAATTPSMKVLTYNVFLIGKIG
ncbi:hypothetical protein [Streptomyces sp. NPDC005385]|uniref:hypothetical protein n=1 Tax=Streptomyces sp. NPDC005385 TaxID=3157039 RepID=UPI0033BF4141